MMVMERPAAFELLDTDRDALGEGPWWSVTEQRLYWVDILGHRVRSADLDATTVREWSTPSEVGFVVPDEENHLVMGLKSGLARLDPATGTITNGPTVETRADHRINDGKTDRAGRVWFGTMHMPETDPTSRLYRADAAGLTAQLDHITTSNGLGWSPDNTVMYYTDSIARRIQAFDFDAATGTITNPRVFAEDPPEYVPDGLTVDADGCVWAAKWNGHRVLRYAPDGCVLADYRFPVARMTSCMFAGPGLRTLVVTSAVGPAGDEPLAGRVFLLDPGVAGLAETPVAAGVLSAILAQRGSTNPPNHPAGIN